MPAETLHSTKPRRSQRARAWQSMRILRRFTARQIVETAELTRRHAQSYIRLLQRGGYVRRTGTDEMGERIYLLIRNTGPKAPRESLPCIWDPNTQKEYPLDEHG